MNFCNTTTNNRYFAGCTTIAYCQAIAYFNPPMGTLNGRFNYPALTMYAYPHYVPYMAADFVYYVANRLGINTTHMTCIGTGAHLSQGLALLNEWGFNYEHSSSNMNIDALTSTLYGGGVVLASGTRKTDNSAHSWVLCGVRGDVKDACPGRTCLNSRVPVNKNNMLYYINWGWGDANDGWYNWALTEHPRISPAPFLADNKQIYLRGLK